MFTFKFKDKKSATTLANSFDQILINGELCEKQLSTAIGRTRHFLNDSINEKYYCRFVLY